MKLESISSENLHSYTYELTQCKFVLRLFYPCLAKKSTHGKSVHRESTQHEAMKV